MEDGTTYTSAAALLCVVELGIGQSDQCQGAAIEVPSQGRQTDTDRHYWGYIRILMGNFLLPYPALHIRRQSHCVVKFGVGQNAGELFASIARHQISRPLQARFQYSGNLAQAVVASLVSVPVVESLEKIYIQHDDGQGQFAARCARPFHRQLLIKITSVVYAGKSVQKHQFSQQIGLKFKSEMGSYPGAYYGRIDRLGDKVHCAQTQSMRLLCCISMCGHKNDRDVGCCLMGLELCAHLKTVHTRHDDIQKHQIWGVIPANRKSLGTAGRHEDLVVASKHLVHDLDIDGLVVHHQ